MRMVFLVLASLLLAGPSLASDWTTGIEASRNRRAQEAAAIQRDVDQLAAQGQTNQLLRQLLAQQQQLTTQNTELSRQLQVQNRLLAEMLQRQRMEAVGGTVAPALP